jgi:hypothetical protein
MKRIGSLQSLVAGISNSKKNGPANSFAWGRGLDFRRESSEVTINPLAAKISGSTVVDLPMDMDVAGNLLYSYGNTGRVYSISTSDVVTNEYTVADSVGNGAGYLSEDRFLYLASNTSLSRRSTATTTGTYYANFLENEGGEPTNTRSIDFEAGSSMSATRADTASLSITGDITLEAFIKPESVPTSGNTMALISKWNESGATRSYKLSLVPTSNFFGDGSDGALTISTDTTEAPIDSACTGTIDTVTLTATNVNFAAGQKVLIHQSQGTGAGTNQVNSIVSYTAGTITLADALNATYGTGAQVRVLKQYTNVTINSGITYTAKAWNGTVGGILAFLASGTVTVTGTISANGGVGGSVSGNNTSIAGGTGGGFRGGIGYIYSTTGAGGHGGCGEGTVGVSARQITANGNGGGGGSNNAGGGSGGGGGGNGMAGSIGGGDDATNGAGGVISGSADLTTMTFGGGGGGMSYYSTITATTASGASGGGIIFIGGVTLTVTGSITSNGGNGGLGSDYGGGGSGAGGSILLKSQVATLGSALITAIGGSPRSTTPIQTGGAGGTGRIAISYYTSYTGTTTPTLNVTQDNALGSSDGTALRFYVSADGTAAETYTQNIDDPTGQWNRFSVAWDASASTAYFYQNGNLLGTKVGALTAIHNNTSIFGLATFVSSGAANTDFYDGLMDDVRVWSDLRTASEISFYNTEVLTGSEGNLVAYYKLDSTVVDAQTSALNTLTANNTPTYSTDIPFSGVTTRSDQDVSIAGSGQAYTLTTALNEGATHRQTFTPTKEPLKSVAFNVATVGTGNWTIMVHDELNRELTSVTVPYTDLVVGVYEFIFASSVRPILNADYHIHIYSTVADGTVATSTTVDLETAYLRTYFQILVSDEYHPMEQFTNFLVIGNERYVAKLEAGSVYNPHRLTLPSGYRVRCFAFWHDYIAIGTWRGDDVTDIDSAKILFWDGTSDTYVEPLDVPQGAINAMFGRQGKLLISAGYRGQFLEYTGGEEAYPIFKIPLAERSDKIEIAPNGITMWQGIIQIGGTFSTDSTTVHQGVYSWGRNDMTEPMSLGFDPLSLGDIISSGVKIGSVLARGKKLYIGYENSGSWGIDVISQSANPYATATVELLNTDLQNVPDVKYPLTFRCDFLPLVSGQSVALKYKPDRLAYWHTLQTQSTTGATEVAGSILQRVKEVQFAVDYVTNGSQITTINYSFDMESPTVQNLRYTK